MNFEQWNGFYGNEWKDEINVRQFIADNYTPYLGDSSFLEGPTKRTSELMARLEELHVTMCVECGCCSYVCPANRPLMENNRVAKNALKSYKAARKDLK